MKKIVISALLFTTMSISQASDITMSKGIKSKLRAKIEKDLNVLNNFKFKPVSTNILELMGMSSLDSNSTNKWLEQRVNYIIEENALSFLRLKLKKTISVERENVDFPNASLVPYSITSSFGTSDSDEGMVVMSNIGAAIYMGGKRERTIYNIKISRGLLRKSTKVAVESPRVGVIQIGEGLFSRDLTINNQNPDSIANSINRLSTFFHEARHSDGNGLSLGFAHATCPTGHEFAGLRACDENLNGPYMIEATLMEEMLKANEEVLTEREKETLKMVILNSYSRVMKTTNKNEPSTNWDPTPESL
jgi:hypothetical protein